MKNKISTCAIALLAAQLLSAGMVLGEDELRCGSGFKMSSNTQVRLTCQRSSTVADQKRAERLSRKWLQSADCTGTLVDPQASIAEAGAAGFLVTVRFICESE